MVNENETLFDQIKTQAVTQVLASEIHPESEVKFQCLQVDVGFLSAGKRLTVSQLSADRRLTVIRLSADRFFGALFFTKF